jgi:hypothetical protein
MRTSAQRPVQAGRGHLEPLVVDALDLEYPRKLPAHRRAIIQRYTAGLVDKEAQEPSAVGRLRIHQLESHAGHDRRDQFFGPQTKNGPKPICSKAFEV